MNITKLNQEVEKRMRRLSKTYRVGETIRVRSGSGVRTVRVQQKKEDVKNGQPGGNGVIVESTVENDRQGSGVWWYDDQII